MKKEIGKLLDKKAISKCNSVHGQFLSPFFLVPKPDGTNRFIINLKELNTFITTNHFKLEDLRTAIKMLTPGMFMSTIDLKDAYFTVPVHKNSRKYLHFCFENQLFEFVCLPFGLSVSPYIFTKIMKPVLSTLREKGFISVNYLDDCLLMGKSRKECKRNIECTLQTLKSLGFHINNEKCQLEPQKTCKFLGFILN